MDRNGAITIIQTHLALPVQKGELGRGVKRKEKTFAAKETIGLEGKVVKGKKIVCQEGKIIPVLAR